MVGRTLHSRLKSIALYCDKIVSNFCSIVDIAPVFILIEAIHTALSEGGKMDITDARHQVDACQIPQPMGVFIQREQAFSLLDA